MVGDSGEQRAVAQADLDALVAACERLYDGLGFSATEWNEALKAVAHAPLLRQVGWQNDLGELHRGHIKSQRYVDNPYWVPAYTVGPHGRNVALDSAPGEGVVS